MISEFKCAFVCEGLKIVAFVCVTTIVVTKLIEYQ